MVIAEQVIHDLSMAEHCGLMQAGCIHRVLLVDPELFDLNQLLDGLDLPLAASVKQFISAHDHFQI